MSRKPRVLFVTEFSQLMSGFATYAYELLPRLHNSGKFEVAELACVPNPHAKIEMADGSEKSICNINIGDQVLTHTGQSQKVIDTYKRNYNGKLIKINRSHFAGRALEVTENHPVLALRKSEIYTNKNYLRKGHTPNIEWIPAGELSVGDLVCYSQPQYNNDILTEFSTSTFTFKADDDFALFIGWFLAEGYVGRSRQSGTNHIGLCYANHEENIAIKIKNYLQKFKLNGDFYKNGNVFETKVSSKEFAASISSLVGQLSHDKYLDKQFFKASSDFVFKMFAAYAEGDGWIADNSIHVKTVSHKLVCDWYRLLVQHGLTPYTTFSQQNGYESYTLTINGSDAALINSFMINKKSDFKEVTHKKYFKIDNLLFYRITQIHKRHYKGEVYNFAVENDQSYICNSFVVHNCYVDPTNPEIKKVPWKVYPNVPHPNDKAGLERYNNGRDNQFGRFTFDEVCIDFQADVVVNFADYWMQTFINKSPLRPYFHYIHMPTVDGEPQKIEWLEDYLKADTILTYSVWGANVLEKQTRGRIKVVDVCSPGPDLKLFTPPVNKVKVKEDFGLQGDTIIVQTVMRNQPRKLYPDLFKSFNKFLEKCKAEGREDLAQKTFLYCHTTTPDVGWNIPEELRKYKLSHKVLFTYMCDKCKSFYPSFYYGEQSVCKSCHQHMCRMPSTMHGLSREQLATVMQIADVYIQYSCSEGFGMCMNDSKACGVPCIIPLYSAMAEQAGNGGALPIRIDRFNQEPVHQTNQLRSFPDNDHLVEQLYKLLTDKELYQKLSLEARECVEKFYNWDEIATRWERVIDNVPLRNPQDTWLSPPKIHTPNPAIPEGLSNEQFVNWIYAYLLNTPEDIKTTEAQRLISILNNGYEPSQTPDGKPIRIPVSREKVMEMMLNYLNYKNYIEQVRWNHFNPPIMQSMNNGLYTEV